MLAALRYLPLLLLAAAPAHGQQDNSMDQTALDFGHGNLSRSNFSTAIAKHSVALVGFVAPWCQMCRMAENAYANITRDMDTSKATFFRVDVGSEKRLADEYRVTHLPHLMLFRNGRGRHYQHGHSPELVLRLLAKQTMPPASQLKTVADVERLIDPNPRIANFTKTTIIGFFSDIESQDSEYEEWTEALDALAYKLDYDLAQVTSRKVSKHFQKRGYFKFTPSVVLIEDGTVVADRRLDEWQDSTLDQWVTSSKLADMVELTPSTYADFEKQGLSMLLLFVKPNDPASDQALSELRKVCKLPEFRSLISFAYADGDKYKDKMAGLGIRHGTSLPALALNTKDDNNYVYDPSQPVEVSSVQKFLMEFLHGRLRPTAAESATPPPAPPDEPALVQMRYSMWNRVIEDPTKDVLLLVYRSRGCPNCDTFERYYSAVARRFRELEIGTVVTAQVDLESDTVPQVGRLAHNALPALYMFSAEDKLLPKEYAGKGKPRPIMLWVQQNADVKFDLPPLPHLTPEQRVEYHRQVGELETQKKEQAARKQALEKEMDSKRTENREKAELTAKHKMNLDRELAEKQRRAEEEVALEQERYELRVQERREKDAEFHDL